MNKKILSAVIILSMSFIPCVAFANDYELPAVNEYDTKYPLPVNDYQTQSYNDYDSEYYNDYSTEYSAPSTKKSNSGGYSSTPSYNNSSSKTANNGNQYNGKVIYVPAQTVVTAISAAPVDSENAKVGDSVNFYLPNDFYFNNDLIARAGSRINGSVVKVGRGTYGNKNGKLQIRFTNIITPSGQMIPITASIKTDDGTGILKAGTFKDSSASYAKNVLIGAAGGAVMGVIMGALSGGHVGRGAIYGTATGAAGGVVGTLFEKGDNVQIPQNVQMDIIFDQPITITTNNPN